MLRALLVMVVALAGCGSRPPPVGPPPPPAGNITWKRVETEADVPREPPPPGTYRIHLIDVGTGLSILVQGADFALLYDAGTNDREEKPIRVVAYLEAVLGASGDELCVDQGKPAPTQRRAIDHVVLSHPHFDHASAMDLVLHCFDAHDVWDSGRINDAAFYREFLAAVGKSSATYHTAASVPDGNAVTVKGFSVTIPRWQRFSEGDTVKLGETAKFTILHADPKFDPDMNTASVVLAVQLGKTRLLLVGDSPSGKRMDPSSPTGEVEEFLIGQHRAEIRADILQVGHHGSKTSSRRGFLEAVHPTLALISSGPKVYGHTVLPDREVIDELHRIGATVLRTDERDANCPLTHRIGPDTGPGGCDSYIITVAP
jgi:competence protein ComEC